MLLFLETYGILADFNKQSFLPCEYAPKIKEEISCVTISIAKSFNLLLFKKVG